jgi:ketosteroid isomerase-like protein
LAGRAASWQKNFGSDNLEGVAALYTEDACRMPPNAEAIKGRDAIVAHLKGMKEEGAAKVKIGVTADETSGDMAHGTGTYEILGADDSHIDHGKWMNVSKKVGGKWLIQCDIWNSDMPVPTGGTE